MLGAGQRLLVSEDFAGMSVNSVVAEITAMRWSPGTAAPTRASAAPSCAAHDPVTRTGR